MDVIEKTKEKIGQQIAAIDGTSRQEIEDFRRSQPPG
jgi:hypothetical protein